MKNKTYHHDMFFRYFSLSLHAKLDMTETRYEKIYISQLWASD